MKLRRREIPPSGNRWHRTMGTVAFRTGGQLSVAPGSLDHWLCPRRISSILARMIGQRLSERLGEPFVIENRPGAGSTIAAEAVAKAAPDGYTLYWATSSDAINASLRDNLSFNFIRDIAPVIGITRVPNVVVVNLSVRVKSNP